MNDELISAVITLLSNTDWRVSGSLSNRSPRKSFNSNGISYVKTRDLAKLRDILEKNDALL